ncbi:MAG: hypothetical protein OXG41_04815 [Acidimicrobiaceae bacterium]|nr:hypothetical protein [Acidimicrobiaceae bacterium]
MSGFKPAGRWRTVLLAAAVVAATLVVPASGAASLNSLGSAPAAAAPAAAPATTGPLSSGSYSPAVGFTALEYPVNFYQRIFNAEEPIHRWGPTATQSRTWFGEVIADERSDSLDVSFAIEGQHDPSGYQFCETPTVCDYVNVRVTSAGLLYLHKQQRTSFQNGYFADFPTRTLEISAADSDTPLKVYREVLVGPPDEAAGCEDYGEDNPDAYACLFLREVFPEETGGGANEAGLRAGLPGLVQDADSYELVFAEDFNGTSPPANSAGCRDGFSILNNNVWNYGDACHWEFLDSRGEPCGNVVDGKLVLADSGRCPGAGLSSGTKLHAKYGYFEVKYTIDAYRWNQYSNYNFVLMTRGEKLRYLHHRYGIEVEDWEDYLTNVDIEIDVFEHEAHHRQDVSHQYGNWAFNFRDADIAPIRTVKWNRLCSRFDTITVNPNLPCRNSDTFTITRGIEWTPRGYRTFIKVDGIHDDFIVVRKEKIAIEAKPVWGTSVGGARRVTGSARDRYFELVDPTDPDTVLEQVVVSHVPLPVNFGAWGWLGASQPYIRTRMKVDYIRLWQPENHYSDMEPVYQ